MSTTTTAESMIHPCPTEAHDGMLVALPVDPTDDQHLQHPEYCSTAVVALGMLPRDDATTRNLQRLTVPNIPSEVDGTAAAVVAGKEESS